MNKQKTIAALGLIAGVVFIVLFAYFYSKNKSVNIDYIDFTPTAFTNSEQNNSNQSNNNNNIYYQSKNNKQSYNTEKADLKIFSQKNDESYILMLKHDNTTIPLMSFYEIPFYKYGLFNDKKSFWLITSSPINPQKYEVIAFYSIDKPSPIKLYQSESEEKLSDLNISFTNDCITINSPLNNIKISKYGQLSNLNN